MNNELLSNENEVRLELPDGTEIKPGPKIIDVPGGFKLLPPRADVCQKCARDHPGEWPHNCDSLYFQYWHFAKYGRWPVWVDAMSHCSVEIATLWVNGLKQLGVPDDRIYRDPNVTEIRKLVFDK